MANYASLRGPIGLNRVYAAVSPGPLNIDSWLSSLKQGRTFATNGPLLGFKLAGRRPGDDLKLPAGENKVKLMAWMRSYVPVEHLQVVCNGEVVKDLKLSADRQSADIEDTIPISRSGWCLLRAFSDKSEYPVLDIYPYASTSPIYVTVEGSPVKSATDAAFFGAWIDRLMEKVKSDKGWNTGAERESVLSLLSHARSVYMQMQK